MNGFYSDVPTVTFYRNHVARSGCGINQGVQEKIDNICVKLFVQLVVVKFLFPVSCNEILVMAMMTFYLLDCHIHKTRHTSINEISIF